MMKKCPLCEREMEKLDKHHLIPRTRHHNKKTKRSFTLEERTRSMILWLCRPCHKNLHRCITNKELEREYHGLEALKAHPEIRRFADWIQDKPPGLRVKVKGKPHEQKGR